MRREPGKQQQKAREAFIEGYFEIVNGEMERQGVRRNVLAERMGCAPANITQIMKQTGNLTAASMVDLAYHLNVKLKLDFISTLSEDGDTPGQFVLVEKNIFNPKPSKRNIETWKPKKNANNLMKIGA